MSKVLERIIASKRLPVLFIGSGLSKRYLKEYPSWDQLLDVLREKVGISKQSFAATKYRLKNEDNSISSGKLNQKLATFLQIKLLERLEADEINADELFSKEEYNSCINDGIDFFKMLVAKTLTNYEVISEKATELDKLQSISQKISMVFTTNYDLFLQKEIFKDFKVYESQNKYYFRTNNGYGEIYKIHGCISDPNEIIFCEKDYQKFENSLKLISSKLLNALIDFPIIFIGYSLEDENIRKIMTDFVSSFDNHILQEIKHYIVLVIYEKGQKELVEGEKQFADDGSGKSITLTTIKTDNFMEIYNYIDKLKPTATAYELRRYKAMVAEIISRAAKGEKTIFERNLDSLTSDEIAIYISNKSSIANIDKSVNIYKNEDIIKKALLREPFDYNLFAQYWYDSKCIKNNEHTPVFLIKQNITVPYNQCCKQFKSNYENKKHFFATGSFTIRTSKNVEELEIEYKLLETKNSGNKYDSFCQVIENSLRTNDITVGQCYYLLNKLLENNNEIIRNSAFKRAACYMWYVEFEK